MSKLVLVDLQQGLYVPQTASAYIYYGSKEKPTDHKGNPISIFYRDDLRMELEAHLNNVVIPAIKNGLKGSNFDVLPEASLVNQAPHPFVEIVRQDKAVIGHADLASLKTKLNEIIKKINKEVKITKSPHLFSQNENSKPGENSKPEHCYTLRSGKM